MNKKQLFDWVLKERPEQFERIRNIIPFSTMFVYNGEREKQMVITRPFNVYIISGDIDEAIKSEEAFRANSLLALQENRWLNEGAWNDYINGVFSDFAEMHDSPVKKEEPKRELDENLVKKFAEVFSPEKKSKKDDRAQSNKQKDKEAIKKESEKVDKIIKSSATSPKKDRK